MSQTVRDKRGIFEVGATGHDEENELETYVDDLTGSVLPTELVREARRAEIEFIHSFGVYRKVPVTKAMEVTGKQPIGVRRIDSNKGDEATPDYRSRLVA